MSHNNKSGELGTVAEGGVARYLAANGFPHAERRRLRGKRDAGDIVGCIGLVVEVKGGNAAKYATDLVVQRWLAETEIERMNAGADLGVLVLQRKGVAPHDAGRWWAVVPTGTLALVRVPPGCLLEGSVSPGGEPCRLLLQDLVHLLRCSGYGDLPMAS